MWGAPKRDLKANGRCHLKALVPTLSLGGQCPASPDAAGGCARIPPPPLPRNRLAQEPHPGSAVEVSHHLFLPRYWVFHGSGGCRTWGLAHVFNNKLFFTRNIISQGIWMMMQYPSILTSQNPSLSRSLSQPQSPTQHRSLAPRGSIDRNSGWCIMGGRISRPSQLNIRSFHAHWKAHYSPVS